MGWAYAAKEADPPVDDDPETPPGGPDWPPDWPPPDDEDGPWPPGWPPPVPPATYSLTVTIPSSIYVAAQVAVSVEARVLDDIPDDTAELKNHQVKVEFLLGAVAVNIKKLPGDAWSTALYYTVTNYSGAKYGIDETVYAGLEDKQGLTLTVKVSITSISPAVVGTDTANLLKLTLYASRLNASPTFGDHEIGEDDMQYCKVATTANHGLTGTSNVDGQSISADDKILVWKQSTASQNGIYTAAAGAWVKVKSFDSDFLYKAASVALGDTYAQLMFVCTTANYVKAMGAVYL